jgi:hypothetical protein
MGKQVGPINFNDISISPLYRVSDWIRAKNSNPMNWNFATEIFRDRINSRFLKPIEHISADPIIREFCGFSILAIDCLLIETLYQFYTGQDETTGYHAMAFWKFFRQSKHFNTQFSRKHAFTFYSHFRCGILHQAQTKKSSIVRICRPNMVEPVDPRNIKEGLIIDREQFHNGIVSEINDYIEKLKINEPENGDLQQNFIKKMDYICRQ